MMQSLSRKGEVNPLVENYGQVIVDECHHIGAVSFYAILKRVNSRRMACDIASSACFVPV